MNNSARSQCDICKKTLVNDHYLKRHKYDVHQDIYKHICEVCNMGFKLPHQKRRHIQTVHKKKIYTVDALLVPAGTIFSEGLHLRVLIKRGYYSKAVTI